MDASRPSIAGREELTQRVLGYLENCKLPPDSFLARKSPRPGIEKGLITIEPNGVHANTTSGEWSFQRPFMVLSILRLLEVPLLNADEVVAWIKRQQNPAGVSSMGKLGLSVREATLAACAMLHWLGAEHDEDGWDRPKLVEALRAQQGEHPRIGHRFAQLPEDGKATASEPWVAFCCIASLAALGETLRYPETAIAHIRSKQEAHGAFSQGWYAPARAWQDHTATVYAVRCLSLLHAEPRDRQACIAAIQSWQVADGGLNASGVGMGRDRVGSSAYETATALLALWLLGAQPPDVDACRRRVMRLWVPEGGGFMIGPTLDLRRDPDVDATDYGLLAMAVLGMLGALTPQQCDALTFSAR